MSTEPQREIAYWLKEGAIYILKPTGEKVTLIARTSEPWRVIIMTGSGEKEQVDRADLLEDRTQSKR